MNGVTNIRSSTPGSIGKGHITSSQQYAHAELEMKEQKEKPYQYPVFNPENQ